MSPPDEPAADSGFDRLDAHLRRLDEDALGAVRRRLDLDARLAEIIDAPRANRPRPDHAEAGPAP